MNSAVEWHDSNLLGIEEVSPRDGEIVIDVYVHRSDGKPGETPGEGGYQRVRINMRSMRFEDHAPELPALIINGALVLGGVEHDDLVPLPMHFEGDVSFTLTLWDDARRLVLSGKGITKLTGISGLSRRSTSLADSSCRSDTAMLASCRLLVHFGPAPH